MPIARTSVSTHWKDEEPRLIQAFQCGDVDAFDLLYQHHYPALVRFLSSRLRDRATAEDVAQETMIRAMRNIGSFDTSRSLWPWLRRIAGNAAIDFMRASGRADALATALSQMADATPVTIDLDDHRIVEQDAISQAMEQVPDRQRRALEQCYVEGWRPSDAAEQFGVGSNAFEQLLHRARGNLRKAYMKVDGRDRAAGLAWFLALVTPLQQAGLRMKRLGQSIPRLGEAALAGVAVASVVVVANMGQPPPDPGADVIPQVPPMVLEVDAPDSLPSVAVPAERQTPVVPTPTDQVEPQAAPVDAQRPAPVAVDPINTLPAPPATEPAGVDTPLNVNETQIAPSVAEPGVPETPQDIPQAVGGCGSAVREVVCAVDDQTMGPVDLNN